MIRSIREHTNELLAIDEDGHFSIFQSKVFFFFVFKFLSGSKDHFQSFVFDVSLELNALIIIFLNFQVSDKSILVENRSKSFIVVNVGVIFDRDVEDWD